MNVLSRGAQWLSRTLQSHASQPAVYHRGLLSVGLNVVVGASGGGVERAGGIKREDRMVAFLFPVADLVIYGDPIEPQVGDRIVTAFGGEDAEFEVARPDAEPPWRYSDHSRVQYRVHACRVPRYLYLAVLEQPKPDAQRDGFGHVNLDESSNWETVANIRINVAPTSGREVVVASQVNSEITHVITTPYSPVVKEADTRARVRWHDGVKERTVNLTAIIDEGESHEELTLHGVEVV